MLRARALICLVGLAAVTGFFSDSAVALSTNCDVNASGGFANCLTFNSPSSERVKSWHVAGRPYRFQLYRSSTASIWGWWEWNDGDYHAVSITISGSVQAQVDNRGTGNPTSYFVEMT